MLFSLTSKTQHRKFENQYCKSSRCYPTYRSIKPQKYIQPKIFKFRIEPVLPQRVAKEAIFGMENDL